jgi:hypothetical protein
VSRSKSPSAYKKNESAEIGKALGDPNDINYKAQSAASTLFERKAKEGVMKQVMTSPYKRISFTDNEKGYDRFLNYHSSRYQTGTGASNADEARKLN